MAKEELLAVAREIYEPNDEKFKEQKLIKTIEYKMQQAGNTDVAIENIRFHKTEDKQYAMADVSYTWWLNAWDKRVKLENMIFVLVDNKWTSPMFM